jgi:FemAB-related protein (PEP-CTERM system-associated)
MSPYEIVELARPEAEEEWRAFVRRTPDACFYHALEWREILSRTFGHRAHYLMARKDGVVRGVLPLVEMRSAMFGHFLVSLPFVDYGGILAEEPDAAAALASAAVDVALKTGAKHIELRQVSPAAIKSPGQWELRQHKAALVIPLASDPEQVWNRLSSRQRGKVRKAERAGIAFSACGPDALDEFYRVFALNMRNLGTPVFSSELFRNVLRLEHDVTILLARRDGRPVAGAIALKRGQRIELPWICSDYTESQLHANDFLYWSSIKWACDRGAGELDLGRCTVDSGTYQFKIRWKPQIRPLFWYYWIASGAEMPTLNPSNPRYALAIRCWKKMPLAIANRMGPLIVRNIP